MLKWGLITAIKDFLSTIIEDFDIKIFWKNSNNSGRFLIKAVGITILFYLNIASLQARHKCPKVPAPPGGMGIISSTTLIPSGSTMAAARSSETSGCDRGHPSKHFYKPQRKRISLFLKDNMMQVSQESAQGQGKHLDALGFLAGCNINHVDFGKIIKNNYTSLFGNKKLEGHQGQSKSKLDEVSERFLFLISNSPLLSPSCKSS